jgi:hypothetical protein
MHRSSDTIATIAAALAKAQIELINPEKSLVATIRSPFPREADRTFRYAPLSSGLDIIRKSLGLHEIATIQATGLDKEAGLLRLTTILAHSSGEWISSEWPVCQIADIASAQRVGAALTYARRYALFTLVGIAGEDDLDAPDLGAAPNSAAETPRAPGHSKQSNGPAVAQQRIARGDGNSRRSASLAEQLSGSLRQALVQQITDISSEDEAAAWAHRNMAAKNTLAAADVQMVEERFKARLSTISALGSTSAGPGDPDLANAQPAQAASDQSAASDASLDARSPQKAPTQARNRSRNDTSHSFGKTVRPRDKQHRKFVTLQPCLICGRVPSDSHHLKFAQPRALGHRVSDEFTVPVCRLHHRELHRSGNEVIWWQKLNIDPVPAALRLWQETRAGDVIQVVRAFSIFRHANLTAQNGRQSLSPFCETRSIRLILHSWQGFHLD